MYFEKQGSGPPVVLIHGLGAYSFSWRDTVAALKDNHTTYAVDLLGFGQSPAPPEFPSTMSAQADAVSVLIKEQGLVDPILIGHSMGGGISLRVAEQAGKNGLPKLEKLILIAPVAFPPNGTFGANLGNLSQVLKSSDFGQSESSQRLVREILEQAYADPERISPQQIDGYAKGLSSRSQLTALLEHRSKLSQVSVPITVDTLIIWGKQDNFIRLEEHGKKLASILPNALLKTIDDCGHIPQEEQPVETNKFITAFLLSE